MIRRRRKTMLKKITAKILQYETEDFKTEEETIQFFQELIDSGLAWKLSGKYGLIAKKYIDEGKINPTPKAKGIRWLLNLRNKGE